MRALIFAPVLAAIVSSAGTSLASDCSGVWREPLRGAVLRAAYYPTPNSLRTYLDLSSVPSGRDFVRASLSITRASDPNPAFAKEVDVGAAANPGGLQSIFELPALAPGAWTVRTRLATRDCSELTGPEAAFVVPDFEWAGNRLGFEPAVVPPFTALTAGVDTVDAVLRRHSIADAGLWKQVVSAGEPLLAEPMRWVVVTDGIPRVVESASRPSLTVLGPDRVRVRANAKAGPLSLGIEGEFEIDGLYRMKLAIRGAPTTRVDRLDLVIPMPSARATLMNAITDETRIHYLGTIPPGARTVWQSSAAPRRQLDAGFVPYLWVGDETRGVALLAESTRDFWFNPGDPAWEIRRRGPLTEIVLHLASSPGPLARDRAIDFALQATPVKPRPTHAGSWRLWQIACDAGEEFVGICPLPAGFYWGTESRYGHLAPRDGGKDLYRWMAEARAGRAPQPPFGEWLDRHGVVPADRAQALASLEYLMRVLAMPSRSVIVYMDAQDTAWGPEFAAYNAEWRLSPFADPNGADQPVEPSLAASPRASYRDRMLWYLDRVLASNAADGVFFDNTFLRATFDDHVGTAYRDERGRLHPGVEIYALRELMKRAQTLVWKRRGGWWNAIHLTTTPISAIHGFAGMSVDGEWQYGDSDYRARFSRDLLRAEGLGSQLGTVPVWLPGIETTSEARREELRRQMFGLLALHEIRVMDTLGGSLGDAWRRLRRQGYGDEACRVAHYWDADPILTVRGVEAKTLAIRCDDRITALIVGFGKGGLAEVVLSSAADVRCRDLERRWERVTPTRGGCRVILDDDAVRMIELQVQ